MHYVILAYPTLASADYDWIQKIRSTHDRQYLIVKPHFTIVFPTDKFSAAELIDYVSATELDVEDFQFTFDRAVIEKNTFNKSYEIHLCATKPIIEIVKLHDVLYAQQLSSELRGDLSYVPHITIASNENKKTIENLAAKINERNVSVEGSIDAITLSSFDGKMVKDIKKFNLLE